VLAPKFLGAPTPAFADDADRLKALADWIARPDNPFFARTQVNRVWYHLLGRGLVEPNDDFRASNPAANEPLLEALTKEFVAHRFDLKYLVRTILNSRTYQLAATPNETNREDEANFARALVKPLPAEPILDALTQVLEAPVEFNGYPLGLRAVQLPGVGVFRKRDRPATAGEQFLKLFGRPERLLTCECERSAETTLGQAFQLISGPLLNRMLSERDNRLGRLLAAGKTNREIIKEFYLAALCRLPTAEEVQKTTAYVERAADRRAGLEDIVWGIVNAKGFLLRQ
jgi:hypothetical protein